jgi:2-C-methyl-D-erythritol 4-phosphate cytidylyltransferase
VPAADFHLAVIIPAAGASRRYEAVGGLRHKLDEDLGGKPVLQRTVELFTKFDDEQWQIDPIIVAGPDDPAAFEAFSQRHGDRLGLLGAKLCRGGREHRWQSVRAALEHVPKEATHIAVHDAARPCMSFELLARVLRAAKRHEAVVPGIAASDTVKRVREEEAPPAERDPLAAILGDTRGSEAKLRVVESTPKREGLYLIQTPQVFRADVLRAAYAKAEAFAVSEAITDDAGVVERCGGRVVVVEGEARNIKITLPADAELARRILNLREEGGRPTHKKF